MKGIVFTEFLDMVEGKFSMVIFEAAKMLAAQVLRSLWRHLLERVVDTYPEYVGSATDTFMLLSSMNRLPWSGETSRADRSPIVVLP